MMAMERGQEWIRRTFALRRTRVVATGITVCALATGALAWGLGGKSFQTGDVLDAKTLTDLWAATVANEEAIKSLSAKPPSYCGSTANTLNGGAGMPLIKQLCEAKCGKPSAHVCTQNELEQIVAAGGQLPSKARYFSGSTAQLEIYGTGKGFHWIGNCEHFTNGASTSLSWATSSSAFLGGMMACQEQGPYMCCTN